MSILPIWAYRVVTETSPQALADDREKLAQILGPDNVLDEGVAIALGAYKPGPSVNPVRLWGHFFEITEDGRRLLSGITARGWAEWRLPTLPSEVPAQSLGDDPEVPLPHGELLEELMCKDCGFPMKTSDPKFAEWQIKFAQQARSLGHLAGLTTSQDLIGRKLRVLSPSEVDDTYYDPNRVKIHVDEADVIQSVTFG